MGIETSSVGDLDYYLDSDLEADLEKKYVHQTIGLFQGAVSPQDPVLENSLLPFLYMAKCTDHFWGFDQDGYQKIYSLAKKELTRMNGKTLPLRELVRLGFLQVREHEGKAVYFPSYKLLSEATRLGSYESDA